MTRRPVVRGPAPDPYTNIHVTLRQSQKTAATEYAKRNGMSFQALVRQSLSHEVERGGVDDQTAGLGT